MIDAKEIERENLIKTIVNAQKDLRMYAILNLPLDVVFEIASYEEDKDVIKELIKKLEAEDKAELDKQDYSKIVNTKSRDIQMFIAKYAPIEVVVQLALKVPGDRINKDINQQILKRLEDENENLEKFYETLIYAKSAWVAEYIAKIVPAELLCEMVLYNDCPLVESVFEERFDELKDLDCFNQNYIKFAKVSSDRVKAFIFKHASTKEIIEIIANGSYYYAAESLLKKLDKDNTIVKESYDKLAKAENSAIRLFVATNAPLEIILDMFAQEEDFDVANKINLRLTREFKVALTDDWYEKFLKANNFIAIDMAIEKISIDKLIDYALTVDDRETEGELLRRFEKEEKLNPRSEIFKKLATAKSWKLKVFGLKYLEVDDLESVFYQRNRKLIAIDAIKELI